MFFLDDLKDLRTYQREVAGSRRSMKDPKKGQLVIFIGSIPDRDFANFLNSGILRPSYFRSIYFPRMYSSTNRKLRKRTLQKDYYDNLNLLLNNDYNERNQISGYMGRNIAIDATSLVEIEKNSLAQNSKMYKIGAIKNAINNIYEIFKDSGYNDVLIVFGTESPTTPDDLIKGNYNLSLINFAIKKDIEFVPELDDTKVTVMFANPKTKAFVKYAVNEENKNILKEEKPKLRLRINQLITSSSVEEINEIIEKNKDNVHTEEEIEKDPSVINDFHEGIKQNELDGNQTRKEKSNRKKLKEDEKIEDTLLQLQSKLSEKLPPEKKEVARELIKKSFEKTEIEDLDVNSSELLDISLRNSDELSDFMIDSLKSENIGSQNLKKIKANEILRNKQEETINSSEVINNLIKKNKQEKVVKKPRKQLNNPNKEMNESLKVNEFDKSYMENKFVEDTVNVFKAFNDDEDISVYITNIDIEDTSDEQTSKNTLSVSLRDDNNINHMIKIDVPKIYDDKYIKVNGSKKIINKMFMMLPIVKTKPNEVWIITDYNKIFVERFGRKTNSQVDYLAKAISKIDFSKMTSSKDDIKIKRGNSLSVNQKYNVSIEYTELSQTILSIELEGKERFVFNNKLVRDEISNNDKLSQIVYDQDIYFPVGFKGRNTIILSKVTDGTLYTIDNSNAIISKEKENQINLSSYIIGEMERLTFGELSSKIKDTVKANESLTYSRVKIINKRVPMIILLAYEKGLFNILDRYDIKYEFTKKNPNIKIRDNKAKIKFEDGWLVYDTSKVRNNLLVSGLSLIDTEGYEIADFNGKTPYLDYFQDAFNSRNVAKGIHNALSLAIDPISKEILEDLELPTNIIDLLLYANTMLEDLTAKQFNDMNIYRIRGVEQINALLYKIVADSYKNYKDSMNNRNPIKMSVPKNALIKSLMELSTVDESSDLNPSLEIDKQTAVTYRGASGRNNSDSYTPEVRGFDPSMTGILGITSPDSATVGVVRQLSSNPAIVSNRGFMNTNNMNPEDKSSLYTPLELLSSFTSAHADPPRKLLRFI